MINLNHNQIFRTIYLKADCNINKDRNQTVVVSK